MRLTVILCALICSALAELYVPENLAYDDYINEGNALDYDSKEVEAVDKDDISDYQIEDNRSDSDDKTANDAVESVADGEPDPDDGDVVITSKSEEKDGNDDIGEVPIEAEEPQADDTFELAEEPQADDTFEEANDDGDDGAWGDFVDDANQSAPESDDIKIWEDAREILDEDLENGFEDQPVDKPKVEESKESQDEMKKMIDDINKILDEANNDYDEQEAKSDEDVFSENKAKSNSEEDTVDKVYADLNDDLHELLETFNKLKDDMPEENENEEDVKVDIKDYEEKHGVPFRELSVLEARDDYYDSIDDSNLSEIFKDNAEDTAAEDTGSNENENKNISGEIESLDESEDETYMDSNIDDLVETQNSAEKIDTADEISNRANIEPTVDTEDAKSTEGEVVKDDMKYADSYDNIDELLKELFSDEKPYGEDGLVDDNQPKDKDAEEIEPMDYENGDDSFDDEEEKSEPKTKSVEELTSSELDDLMTQFVFAHQEDLDISSEDFDKDVAPVHMTLSTDEVLVITSPNYPEPYPTNNIIDWILEGEGMGIELNITDFDVNGALGDYLLVKPGGLDETGHEGLIFSYHLDSERKYRFTDVNRMFMRFEAKANAVPQKRGFKLSVKMIFPPSENSDDVPEPEAIVIPPRHTLTVNLAGLNLRQFREIKGDFAELIADMATHYINLNGIDQGLNTTLEVAQVTRSAICSIHWPDYETCVEVTFGVPLNYGDEDLDPRLDAEDLEDMWNTLIRRENFATRLEAMGIKEYVIPNDRTALIMWSVIAAGVVVSMAMLGFALWRFSCFEDYTRMKSFSDTDSVRNEKRNLDLYPTPHQTLPPLYTDNEYKWTDDKYDDSTRVDMGGFANKSYVRGDLYDFDSDEDIVEPRDRYTTNV